MEKPALQDATILPYTLRSIYLRDSSTRMGKGFDPLLPGQPLMGVFRTNEGMVELREATIVENSNEVLVRTCAFTTRFEFAYTKAIGNGVAPSDQDIEEQLAAQITADITVDYLFNGPSLPGQEALAKWASSNVILHAWPYWREFCHSVMLRMSLPVTMIPMLQISPQPGENNKETDTPAARRRKKSQIKTPQSAPLKTSSS